jgi:chemotaxis-related protein WspB
MLFVAFRIGNDQYGIDAASVVELLPLVNVKQLPQAPRGIAGLLDYHGALLPAIDLSLLAVDRPSRRVMSTRVAVVQYTPADGQQVLLALILESAVQTVRRDAADFAPSGVDIPEAPYLGGVARHDGGVLQEIEVARLIPDDLRRRLVPATGGAA